MSFFSNIGSSASPHILRIARRLSSFARYASLLSFTSFSFSLQHLLDIPSAFFHRLPFRSSLCVRGRREDDFEDALGMVHGSSCTRSFFPSFAKLSWAGDEGGYRSCSSKLVIFSLHFFFHASSLMGYRLVNLLISVRQFLPFDVKYFQSILLIEKQKSDDI